MYLSISLSVLRSDTSCFVLGPSWCHIGSSCKRMFMSKDLAIAFSTVTSSESICQIETENTVYYIASDEI